MKRFYYLLSFVLITASPVFAGQLRYADEADEARSAMLQLRRGMSKEDVLFLLGYPYKAEREMLEGKRYEIWYYITDRPSLSQTRMLPRDLSPVVFDDENILIGWGRPYYRKVFERNGEIQDQTSQPSKQGWTPAEHGYVPSPREEKIKAASQEKKNVAPQKGSEDLYTNTNNVEPQEYVDEENPSGTITPNASNQNTKGPQPPPSPSNNYRTPIPTPTPKAQTTPPSSNNNKTPAPTPAPKAQTPPPSSSNNKIPAPTPAPKTPVTTSAPKAQTLPPSPPPSPKMQTEEPSRTPPSQSPPPENKNATSVPVPSSAQNK